MLLDGMMRELEIRKRDARMRRSACEHAANVSDELGGGGVIQIHAHRNGFFLRLLHRIERLQEVLDVNG